MNSPTLPHLVSRRSTRRDLGLPQVSVRRWMAAATRSNSSLLLGINELYLFSTPPTLYTNCASTLFITCFDFSNRSVPPVWSRWVDMKSLSNNLNPQVSVRHQQVSINHIKHFSLFDIDNVQTSTWSWSLARVVAIFMACLTPLYNSLYHGNLLSGQLFEIPAETLSHSVLNETRTQLVMALNCITN